MSFLDVVIAPSTLAARLLNPLQAVFALGARLTVSMPFLKAGYFKATRWDSTLLRFASEYPVPWLSPHDAAVAGTFGEVFLPALLVIGLYGRLSALGLFIVNAMATVAFSRKLLAHGAEAALGQHILWGTLLLAVIVYGPGKWSLDHFMNRARA